MSAADTAFYDPVFLVHSLDHAVAALKASATARRPVVLASAPAAGGYGGAGWFRALLAAARETVPAARFTAFLDCGDSAGAVLGALRTGIDGVIFVGRTDVARRLTDIARREGVRFATTRPDAALDLGADVFAAEAALTACCAAYLARLEAST